MGNNSSSNTVQQKASKPPTISIYSKSLPSNTTRNSFFLVSHSSRSPTFKLLQESTPSFKPSLSSSSPLSQGQRRSSLLNIHNGVTTKYISSRICKIAAEFWLNNVDKLSHYYQLEVGCSICFGMLSTNNDIIKHIMKSPSAKPTNIETMSLKYLEMIGWLIRHLSTDGMDLYALLTKLGSIHQAMGIKITHFGPMLNAMHETFSYYFDTLYTMEIRYAMDEIFILAAQIMTGQDLKCAAHLNDTPFLRSLDICLKSCIGKEYLYRYLAQMWCDEIVIFLKSLFRFKNAVCDKERFMIARDITKTSIQTKAIFALNLSYEKRFDVIKRMSDLEKLFLRRVEFEVPLDFFVEVELETRKLIMNNHWQQFVKGVKVLQLNSFYV